MAEMFPALTPEQIEFIGQQHVFFVGTAGAEGRVNVSPKGMDSFRVLAANQAVWLNVTGSGNETAAHVAENSRMTVMFCSFDRQPLILRLYGTAEVVHPRDEARWSSYSALFKELAGARQFYTFNIDLVQTSCGYAVPHYEQPSERVTLRKWANNKSEEELTAYWEKRNQLSIDGKPTHIFESS